VYPDAERLESLDYMRAISEQLGVMDTTAVTMCMENDLPIRVFNMTTPGNVAKAVRGEPVGTLVDAGRTT
jgi:uridylate kinase